MNSITDDDLVLYHYRDGLDAERIEQITAALAGSPALRDRYAKIEQAVANFDHEEIAPDASFNARLWKQLEPQLEKEGIITPLTANRAKERVIAQPFASRAKEGVVNSWATDRASISKPSALDRLRAWLTPAQLWPAFAATTVLAVAIGAGFLVGRQSATIESPPIASAPPDAAAMRVLDAYVAANLRATERVLLTASNSEDASLLEGNRELAESLVESNRLYALAAARSGNTKLATFLRELEPVLISLANQPGSAAVQSSEELRQFLDTTDLLFQVRATEARLDRAPDNDGDSRI